jgi:hypothetical protein
MSRQVDLLAGEKREEGARIKGNLLAIDCGLATVSRAASQLTMVDEMQQDRRGRLTFWRLIH